MEEEEEPHWNASETSTRLKDLAERGSFSRRQLALLATGLSAQDTRR